MEEITARRALELLTDVVDTYGEETRYTRVELHSGYGEPIPKDCLLVEMGCRYFYNGAPSCLVGHVLHRAGWSVNALRNLDDGGIAAQDLWYADLPQGATGLTQGAALALEKAQELQDVGDTWGEALKGAVQVAAEGSNSGI